MRGGDIFYGEQGGWGGGRGRLVKDGVEEGGGGERFASWWVKMGDGESVGVADRGEEGGC